MTEQLRASLTNERMQRLYDYWASRRRDDGRPPRREDIEPGDVPDLLPYVFLVDIEEAPRRYRYRLAGSEVVACFGVDMTGLTIDELDLGEKTEQIRRLYDETAASGEPHYDRYEFWTASYQQHLNYERLLLPLSSNGERIDKLLGCAFALPVPAARSSA